VAKPPSNVDSNKLSLFDALIATVPGIERKGATVPYTSHNGNMFSYLSKQGTLSLRLPDGPREAFLKKYKTRLCSQYGVVQKEYVEVPDALLRKTSELKQYFAVSYQHVKSLKPKPSVAKKKPA
jgi:TfoX/Sxy family transcriptional regulator of competence genes